jgi:hypothetical protein
MKALARVLTHSALVELAGERYFERGEQYHRETPPSLILAHVW